MKKYDIAVDIRSTGNELKRAIRWRELGNSSKQELAGILDKQINNHCDEIVGQYHLVMSDYQKELLSTTQYRRCLNEFKQLFKEYKYYKCYNKSLMDLKNEIEEKATLNEVKQMG